jgi:hypothetical protein
LQRVHRNAVYLNVDLGGNGGPDLVPDVRTDPSLSTIRTAPRVKRKPDASGRPRGEFSLQVFPTHGLRNVQVEAGQTTLQFSPLRRWYRQIGIVDAVPAFANQSKTFLWTQAGNFVAGQCRHGFGLSQMGQDLRVAWSIGDLLCGMAAGEKSHRYPGFADTWA